MVKLSHFFIPHPDTHKKAHLISTKALIFYIVLFLILQLGLGALQRVKPGVLGISSGVDQHALIDLTNEQRQENGMGTLKENSELDQAAAAKAQNMFQENYWAHFAPSGKSPWDFIQGAGYKYSYAGENLARNFYNSPDVVNAWMASPSHRENILNPHYKDIGIAVVQGVLQGQQTTLVVQEFGSPVEAVAAAPEVDNSGSSNIALANPQIPVEQETTLGASGEQNAQSGILLDPYKITKYFGGSLLFVLIALLILDVYIIKRRGITRIGGRHMPQIAFLVTALCALLVINPGGIL